MSFVIPVRNDAAGVTRCLTSIEAAAAGRRYEVIVVDNGSVDGSADAARRLGASVLRVDGKVARLRNAGAGAARGELLAFVDADHELDPQWVDAAVQALEDTAIAAVGAEYTSPHTANWVQRTYDLLRDHRAGRYEAAWLGSGNVAVRRSCFDAIGGFDEDLETCEDVDLCQRLRRAGYRVLADSRLRSIHYGDPSTLRRLFVAELWRGRDNLRVTLREPSLRELVSVAIPVFDLGAGAAAVVALVVWRAGGLSIAVAAALLVLTLSSLRTWRMTRHLKVVTVRELAQAWSVAVLYDVARALAPVVRAPHRRAAGPLATEQ